MSTWKRILIFFVLPIIGVLSFPPATLLSAPIIIVIAILVFSGLGYLLWRGRTTALTLAIFLQGLNVIVRLMMFFPHAVNPVSSSIDLPYIIANLLGLGLSLYLLLRMDRPDVRVQMVT